MLVSLDYKKGQESLYQRDFQPRGTDKHIPLLDHNKTYKSKLPMEMQTIQRVRVQLLRLDNVLRDKGRTAGRVPQA